MEPAGGAMQSCIEYSAEHPFPLENIPFGVFFDKGSNKWQCCTRIGDKIVNLAKQWATVSSCFTDSAVNVFDRDSLNDFAACGPEVRKQVREAI